MAAHLSQEQIDQYKRRRLAPDELLWVDDHISECVDCRQRIASGAELWAAFQSKPLAETSVSSAHADLKGKHLTYEELEVLVDGKMGDKQAGTLRAHLEFCQSCSEGAPRASAASRVIIIGSLVSGPLHNAGGWYTIIGVLPP